MTFFFCLLKSSLFTKTSRFLELINRVRSIIIIIIIQLWTKIIFMNTEPDFIVGTIYEFLIEQTLKFQVAFVNLKMTGKKKAAFV